jgi:hypothetical protein
VPVLIGIPSRPRKPAAQERTRRSLPTIGAIRSELEKRLWRTLADGHPPTWRSEGQGLEFLGPLTAKYDGQAGGSRCMTAHDRGPPRLATERQHNVGVRKGAMLDNCNLSPAEREAPRASSYM